MDKAMIADGPHEGEVIEGPLPPVLQRLREVIAIVGDARGDTVVRYVRESYRLQAAIGPDGEPRHRYTWVPSREPGIYAEEQLVLPAADPDAPDEGLRLELVYERSRDAVVDIARAQIDRWRRGEQFDTGLLDDAVAAHDKAKVAHLAHGGSVWVPDEDDPEALPPRDQWPPFAPPAWREGRGPDPRPSPPRREIEEGS